MNKAVILARGLGTRMRRADDSTSLDEGQARAADAGIKAMIPIGRPFLDYVLSSLADAGYQWVCMVVAPDHEVIRRYYAEEVQLRRLHIEFAVQVEPRGTADAVAAAESFAGDDPILVVNSDTYYPALALEALRYAEGCAAALFEQESMFRGSNIPEERIRSFAVAKINAQGNLERIVEKPSEEALAALPRPLWLSMNCWRFTPAIFQACRSIQPSARGELELPDAVQYVIDVLEQPFQAVKIQAPVLDLTSRRDITSVAERLAGKEVEL